MKKIKVGAVSYLNTKPLLYGIRRHEVMNDIELSEAYPSRIADMLIHDIVDVALIPVAVIPELREHHIVSDYCIGADGEVASVCIFSDVPLEQVTTIYLDYQSRTSVMLARVLLKEYWHSKAGIINAPGEEYISKIKGTTAGLIIGDRAFEQRHKSKYIYDLATAWKEHTGLPFVFATWVSNKPLPQDFIRKFNEANKEGLENMAAVIKENSSPYFDMQEYFTKCISYQLDSRKKEAMNLFLEKIAAFE